jgi:hypothetical protein
VNPEEYCRTDGWPAENERGFIFKATSEIPLRQVGQSFDYCIYNYTTTVTFVCFLQRRKKK